ncbi:MAG: hypothetical protein M9913_13330 [Bryobacteraceae bacterium]|nr:hypothetical protein [Solibacteraceae bacterium]MCL4843228.1 hypothetical protein [Bryobacteraceae bacterium]MCO5351855.1 hypothetical protein [Bryobacteraceae bacterium]
MNPAGQLKPLAGMYAGMGLALPRVRLVEPSLVPEPYRRLLVHRQDMTPTLEAAHGASLHLRVIRHTVSEELMDRLVVLELDGSGVAVEVGAIQIHLARLPDLARVSVLAMQEPFGAILRDHGLQHSSEPSAFFEIAPDALIADALGTNGVAALHGRASTIRDAQGEILAEVVEILPPADTRGRQ